MSKQRRFILIRMPQQLKAVSLLPLKIPCG
jgi:hypothetical protein